MTNRRRFLILGVWLLGMYCHSPATDRYAPGTLIVKLASSSSVAALSTELVRAVPSLQKSQTASFNLDPLFSGSASGLSKQAVQRGFASERYLVVRFKAAEDADAAFAYLVTSSAVEYVQRNYIYRIDAVPNDSASSSQWSLKRMV
jgi:hypothetical protein